MTRTAIVTHPIDVAALIAEVAADGAGATSLFLGTVRDVNDGRAVTGMEYTAYDAMAERELARIAAEAVERFGWASRSRLSIASASSHLGDASASRSPCVASAPSRMRLDAATAWWFVIEEIKKRVPIWKREHYADGTREWVDPTAERSGAMR